MTVTELINISSSGTPRPGWALDTQQNSRPDAAAMAQALSSVRADAVLCLDERLPLPDEELLTALLDGPCDVWHGGLRLGMAGQMEALDHVYPQWTFSLAATDDVESTSWELSLRALLVRRSVLDQLDGPDPAMDTLAGAGLELGLRWIRAGALVRHVPALVPAGCGPDEAPSHRDQFRTVTRHHGQVWAGWALQRSTLQRRVPVLQVPRLARAIRSTAAQPAVHYASPPRPPGDRTRTVSVILPTIDRYAYLEPLLHQLAAQTVVPHEVFIVDQTSVAHRRSDLTAVEPNLSVTVIGMDRPGQSTARNAALHLATGDTVLFLDDDLDIEPDLVTTHLDLLVPGIDAVCGGVDDATAGPPPPGFRHRRASDVFPGGHSHVCRSALTRSGLFDPVFDHGPRADRDLGVRLHLSGALVVYEPSVMVFHHHAPMGGLRTHGARKVTRASARRSLTERNLPAVTELYLGHRYFTAHQRREARAVRLLSILSGTGGGARRITRGIVQLALLPHTIAKIRSRDRAAGALLQERPPIPALDADETSGR